MATMVPTKPVDARISFVDILDRVAQAAREQATGAPPDVAARLDRVVELAQALQTELRALAGGSPPSSPSPEQKR
jgi:hypothetical protein